jgi:ApbE superfamily uncharacterized protein (UPF0280 family)
VPLRSKRKGRFFEVPVQDMVLRVAGPEELYEQARATGMQFWEQLQSYAIRNPAFRISKSPLILPDDAPATVRRMAALAGRAGVGPMFTFQGALTEYVGTTLARTQGEILVSCGGDHFVVTRRRSRLRVHPGVGEGQDALAVVVKPELGPQGIFTTSGQRYLAADTDAGIVVVASSCILADAAAAGAMSILSKPRSLRPALAYLRGLTGVHGAMIVRGDRIGVAGNLELAA